MYRSENGRYGRRTARSLPSLVTAAIARRRRRRTCVVGAGRPRNPTLVVGPPTDRVFGHRAAVRRRRPTVSGPRLDVRLPPAAVSPAVRAGLRRRYRYRRVTRRVVGATFLRRDRDRWPPVLARRGTVGRRFRSTYRLRSAGLVGSSRDVPLRPQPAAPATVAAHGRVLRVPHSVAPALAVGATVHRAAVGRSEKHVLNTNVFFEKLSIFRPRGTVISAERHARTKTRRVRDRSGNLRGSRRRYHGYRR